MAVRPWRSEIALQMQTYMAIRFPAGTPQARRRQTDDKKAHESQRKCESFVLVGALSNFCVGDQAGQVTSFSLGQSRVFDMPFSRLEP